MPAEPFDPQFFDGVYRRAAGDEQAVPWQQALSRNLIGEWIDAFDPAGFASALVVAAGLGDDAAALAARGLAVTAFDVSPTAVEWAQRRHPDAAVDWHVADLLDPPEGWNGSFDLVVEVFNVQSVEPRQQPAAARSIRRFVAPGGTLVAVAVVRSSADEPAGPPWPIHDDTLNALVDRMTPITERRDQLDERPDGAIELVLVEARDTRPSQTAAP